MSCRSFVWATTAKATRKTAIEADNDLFILTANSLAKLLGGDACRRFKTADLIDLHPFVGDACIKILEEIAGQVLGRRVKLLVKRRQLVQIAVVEIFDYLVGGGFEVAKIDEQTDIIQ